MIKYNLKSLIADKSFREKRKITYDEISEHTRISKATISKIASSVSGYNASTDVIEKLSRYFKCGLEDLMTVVPDDEPGKGE